GDRVAFQGEQYKIYQDAIARVEYVVGEFYWKVEVGEQARAVDYVHPPRMLSMESSMIRLGVEEVDEPGQTRKKKKTVKSAPSGEINWSLGTYMKRKDVEKTFGVSGLPRTSKIAPNQLYPYKKVYRYWGLMLVV